MNVHMYMYFMLLPGQGQVTGMPNMKSNFILLLYGNENDLYLLLFLIRCTFDIIIQINYL